MDSKACGAGASGARRRCDGGSFPAGLTPLSRQLCLRGDRAGPTAKCRLCGEPTEQRNKTGAGERLAGWGCLSRGRLERRWVGRRPAPSHRHLPRPQFGAPGGRAPPGGTALTPRLSREHAAPRHNPPPPRLRPGGGKRSEVGVPGPGGRRPGVARDRGGTPPGEGHANSRSSSREGRKGAAGDVKIHQERGGSLHPLARVERTTTG